MNTDYKNITVSLEFLRTVVDNRLRNFLSTDPEENLFTLPDLKLEPSTSPINNFLITFGPNIEEYIILLLALVPHIQPNFLETIVREHLPEGGDFLEMGGVKGDHYRGMLPTGETALFLLGGTDIAERIRLTGYFSTDHYFSKKDILRLEPVREGEPRMSGKLIISQEFVDLLTLGYVSAPAFSSEFPAKKITTQMDWDDLVLRQQTCAQIDDIKIWLEQHPHLNKDTVVRRKIKPGYRVLFYGASGTGKTLTATLLGKYIGREVYRIDLSQVVSKYIGETEKNLERVFRKAENKDWILFFDEADALFGKRSNISNAHDKYANQEVSYLLQRVEDYSGLIILASNFKNNIDQAFIRRFNAIIHFPSPDPEERLAIWEKNVPVSIPLNPDVELKWFAHKYELSGSAISNVMQYAALHALSNGRIITRREIENGVRRELLKEDKVF
jgi:hypothetical protein